MIPVEAVKKLRRDATSEITETLRHLIPAKANPDVAKPKIDPDSAFYDDPDYSELRRHFIAAEWIQSLKLARPMAARHPESPKGQISLGVALLGIGLHEQAEATLKNGLILDPESSAAWGTLGFAQDAQQKTAIARESWKRAAGLSPDDARFWRALAVSYLKAGEYIEAISPLENLRKTNLPEFDALLLSARSLRAPPPQLQAMLSHFETIAKGIATTPPKALPVADPTATTPEQLASGLVAAFLRHGQGPEVQTELADYADVVNPYFDQGQKSRAAILDDITTYRRQWPLRTLQLVTIESAKRDDLNTLQAVFRLSYTANDGKQIRRGTLVQKIRFSKIGGRWLDSGIQTVERVKNQRLVPRVSHNNDNRGPCRIRSHLRSHCSLLDEP